MIYVTADTHYYHTNIIRHCNRPFLNVEEMNNTMIKNHNKIVKKLDEIIFLGDFCFYLNPAQVSELCSRLNGKKYLITGNHDKNWLKKYRKSDFNDFIWIKDYHVLKYNGQFYVLSHYPMLNWEGRCHGSTQLYGHIHNNPIEYVVENSYNVGVDVNNFTPMLLNNIGR